MISIMDYIRMDGGGKEMLVMVEPRDAVASIMEEVRRRRRYPLAMQKLKVVVSDAGAGSLPDKQERRWISSTRRWRTSYDVKEDSVINLHMNMAFAIQADREARGVNNSTSPPPASSRSSPTMTSDPARSCVYQRRRLLISQHLQCFLIKNLLIN